MTSLFPFWQRIRRTPYQTIASVLMVFITLFVVAIFLFVASLSLSLMSYFETKPQLTVFFKDEKEKESIEELMKNLRSTGKVASLSFISKEQALAIYREQNKNDPLLLEMVTADILPASLEISATSPQYLSELAEMVKKEKGIDEVVFQKEIVDTLISWTSTVRKFGLIFIFFLSLSSFFIILTSISLKIALHKEEIEILRLVGATSWYIQKPFILEGIVYGVSGAILAFLVAGLLIFYASPFLNSFLRGVPSLTFLKIQNFSLVVWPFSFSLFLVIGLILIFFGFFLGLAGSFFATSRYLR